MLPMFVVGVPRRRKPSRDIYIFLVNKLKKKERAGLRGLCSFMVHPHILTDEPLKYLVASIQMISQTMNLEKKAIKYDEDEQLCRNGQ